MPRDYDDEDDRDDRPRKRRRRDDDDDRDRPPAKSNTGLILLIVGLVVGLPILACAGVGIWGFL
jgi:nitrate reductase NapE component